MGIISSPLGKIKQSVGGMTFGNWKGLNVVKAKATEVSNPKTAAQVSQRTQMSGIVKLARTLLVLIKTFWTKQAIKMSEYNAFVRDNIKAITYSNGVLAIDPSLFVFTKGVLQKTPNVVTATTDSSTQVTLNYDGAFSSISYGPNVKIGITFLSLDGQIIAPSLLEESIVSSDGQGIAVGNFDPVFEGDYMVLTYAFDTYTKNVSDAVVFEATKTNP